MGADRMVEPWPHSVTYENWPNWDFLITEKKQTNTHRVLHQRLFQFYDTFSACFDFNSWFHRYRVFLFHCFRPNMSCQRFCGSGFEQCCDPSCSWVPTSEPWPRYTRIQSLSLCMLRCLFSQMSAPFSPWSDCGGVQCLALLVFMSFIFCFYSFNHLRFIVCLAIVLFIFLKKKSPLPIPIFSSSRVESAWSSIKCLFHRGELDVSATSLL